ncbi:RNA-directed DNA polymerase, eukaryota, reverse transcriptase zinc-binding domain protein [Tanacetum coccineum]
MYRKDRSCSVMKDYHEAIQDEYSLLCQKAKVEWLKEGDRNTAYFHRTIKERVHRGRIMTIRNEEGIRFGRPDIFNNKIKPDEALRMVRPITWSIIRKEVCQAVREFFFVGKLLGERVDYFKGGRGLRQRDPISPYLFILVMEVLNMLIKKNIKENMRFKYHFGCKNMKITHLCFADDLLVLCHGDSDSVKVIKKSLDEFSGYTGQLPNMQKSTICFGGLSSAEKQTILNIIPFTEGKFPVQLIASVLNSMQNYWDSIFLLPKQVIYEIKKILKGFLWCQGELTKGKAKVSWDGVCKPKDQGGLGLKNLGVWNEVLMIKHLWNVAVKKDKLWVKWIYMEKLKGRNVWKAQFPILRDDIEDTAVWISGNGLEKNFKISNVWKDMNWNETKIIIEMKALPLNKNIWSIYSKETVVMKLLGLKVKDSSTVKEVEEKWKIKLQRG